MIDSYGSRSARFGRSLDLLNQHNPRAKTVIPIVFAA
jgi:hypothetical protein